MLWMFVQIQELNGKKFENPQTANLHKILEDAITISELLKERNNPTEGSTEETDNTVSKSMALEGIMKTLNNIWILYAYVNLESM